MTAWKKIISRETTLFERYLKMAGYTVPLLNTAVATKNILTISDNGISDQYFDEKEIVENTDLLHRDYTNKKYLKVFSYSFSAMKKLIQLTTEVTRHHHSKEAFIRMLKQYFFWYGRVRAAVLYTHLPLQKFEEEIKKAILISDQKEKDECYLSLIHPTIEVAGLKHFFKSAISERKKKQQYLKQVQLSQSVRQLIHYFEQRGYLHEVGERITTEYSFPSIVRCLQKDTPTVLDDVSWYLPDEIIEYIQTGKRVSEKDLLSRKQYYVLLSKRGVFSLFVGREAHAKERRELNVKASDQKTNEFQGRVAYRGSVQGNVMILRRMEDMQKCKDGFVLVTSMTRPQWMPTIKKCKAIVTDEGGILSHAAIVSRELHKPCIIGTKIATKILKDGDLVEVDADTGVVRVLKRAGSD